MQDRISVSLLSSYCPCSPPPVFPLLQGAIAPCRSPRYGVRNTGREASCVSSPEQSEVSAQLAASLRGRNRKQLAARLILMCSSNMILASIAASKLCADKPRHAQVMRLSAACLRSTWQGGGHPLRCILPRCRKRHVETLPVSTPSGLRRPAAFPAWAVRP